jgi:ubiquinone/menaquinone biosynthesis C-methylase UbiE
MKYRFTARELAHCGLFGAAGLLFPVVFHLVRLGHVFMPMYLPLMTLAFFVPWVPAAATALAVPVLSGALTGMPPFYPPVAVFMALELAVMAAVVAAVVARRPRINERLLLIPVLAFGRAFYVALVYAFSLAVKLPAGFMTGLSFFGGWPGLILMIVVIPPVARLRRGSGRSSPDGERAAADTSPAKLSYFDDVADKWDGWEDLSSLSPKLSAGLAELGVGPDEAVLDVGCGTGNLTQALLARLSPAGRVTAIDFAPAMIKAGRRKVRDARVEWLVAEARRLPLPDASCDRAFCYSVWPHIDNRKAVAAELGRVLRPGGILHIWHLLPRKRINEIHASAGGPIRGDLLPPASETADLLAGDGFRVTTVIDDDERYLVTAVRAETSRAAEAGRP